MSTASPPRLFKPNDLLSLPDGKRYELVDGQLIEDRVSIESVWVAGRIFKLLAEFVEREGRGDVFPDGLQLRCFADADRIRRPDASFVKTGRLGREQFSQGFCPVPPDLVVEVISPNDAYYEVERKADEYLEAGIALVWVISPESRTVVAYHQRGTITHLTSDQFLTGDEVLPGFSCAIANLFPSVRS